MTLFGIHSFNLTQPHGGANPMSPEELPTISYRTLPLCPHPETAFFEIFHNFNFFVWLVFKKKCIYEKYWNFFLQTTEPFFRTI